MGKNKWNQAGRGYALFMAAAVSGLMFVCGNPAWAGISGNTGQMGQENQAVTDGQTATPCNAEKKTGMESARKQAEELYTSATEVILPEPYRRGYIFLEWNTEPDGSGEFYSAGEVVRITEMTLYAVWEKDETEGIISVETATASNAKWATASNAERVETAGGVMMAEAEEASDYGEDTEPEEETGARINRISEIKRATESNARWMGVQEEMETESEIMEEIEKWCQVQSRKN